VLTAARLTDPNLASAPFREIEYVLVGSPALLKKNPLTRPEDAKKARAHRLRRRSAALSVFQRSAPGQGDLDVRARSVLEHHRRGAGSRARGASAWPSCPVLRRRGHRKRRLRVILRETKLRSNQLKAVWRKGHPYEAEIRELAAELASRAESG
jgi:hypothetical protein